MEDPYVMAIVYEILCHKFKVVGVKNLFIGESDSPPCLLLNIDFKDGWIVEVQLVLKNILLVKKEQHKVYKITRAKSFEDLLQPLFRLPFGEKQPPSVFPIIIEF
jgi:hypothetical protein